MISTLLRFSALLLALACIVNSDAAAEAAAKPLECPSGSVLKTTRDSTSNRTVEFCVDTKTKIPEGPMRELSPDGKILTRATLVGGKAEGVMRKYDLDGNELMRSTFEHGEITDLYMTIHGLRASMAKLTANARPRKDASYVLSAIDEHTLAAEFHYQRLGPDVPAESLEQLRQHLREGTCEMFPGAFTQIKSMRITVLAGEEKKPVVEDAVMRADCANLAAAPANVPGK